MVLRYSVGATITLDDAGIDLLSETPGRVVVAIEHSNTDALKNLATQNEIPLTKIGVTGGESLTINGCVISLTELREAHTSTFPRLFG